MATQSGNKTGLRYLVDLWDHSVAATLMRSPFSAYRSNLLGSDLRLTNFAGGNTSSKLPEVDPLTGEKWKFFGQGKRWRSRQPEA